MTLEEGLEKLKRFCAYQDRCHQEVRQKCYDLGIYGDWTEQIIAELIKEKFLDEVRFAQSFTRGKFINKQWGRNRIIKELKSRNITEYCIRKGMEEIEEEQYRVTLEKLYDKKLEQFSSDYLFKRHQKAMQFCIRKGYESEMVYDLLKQKQANHNE